MDYKSISKVFAGIGKIRVNSDPKGVSISYWNRDCGADVFNGSMKVNSIVDAKKLIKAMWMCIQAAEAGTPKEIANEPERAE